MSMSIRAIAIVIAIASADWSVSMSDVYRGRKKVEQSEGKDVFI